jgi:hypothetical protein
MMNPGFSFSDNAIQEVINFPVVLQKTAADVLAIAPVLFRSVFGHPLRGNFVETKNIKH